MIHPTISDLTKDNYNRYQLAIATAKCARMITDEYVKQRTAAESSLTGSKESGTTIASLIDPTLANEKAVKNAINGIYNGTYEIVDAPEVVEEDIIDINED